MILSPLLLSCATISISVWVCPSDHQLFTTNSSSIPWSTLPPSGFHPQSSSTFFVLCVKWPLWKNQKHWQNTQLDLNSDTGMSFQPSNVRKRHLFLDWNIFRCCSYLKLFHTERAYGELGCLAWFYLAGKLHNFPKCKYWFAVLGWFVSLFEFSFLWVYQKKSKISHNRKHFFFFSLICGILHLEYCL